MIYFFLLLLSSTVFATSDIKCEATYDEMFITRQIALVITMVVIVPGQWIISDELGKAETQNFMVTLR
jgi:hypothetical protein